MKKHIRFIVAAALVLAGCASAPEPAAPTAAEIREEQGAANTDVRPRRSAVIDWNNRNLGEDPVPLWLKPLVKGNSGPVKSEFGLSPDARIRYSIAQRPNREEARVQAGLLFAAQVANELKTCVMTAAAQTLNEGQIDIIEEITTAAKVSLSGNERVADFWQLVETEDPATKIKSKEYIYYIVWSMPEATWTALTRKYVNDVIGKIPDRQVQINVAQAYGDIEAAANREQELSDAEFQQKLRLQEQAARDAQARELARINQQTAASAAATEAAARTAQAEAAARYAAYQSGDPASAAAAATTAGDIDWIRALNAAGSVIF
jgi:hypothetical protein